MRVLILGGTVYLGRHIVDAARTRGHAITLFNRGQSNPELFPDVERLRGDRTGDLGALRGRSWDVVIDTCGYLPSVVRASAEVLRDAVGHYTFISSISVYADNTKPGLAETDPVARLEPNAPEELQPETYGALKALCEEALESLLPGRVHVVRAGLIFGPHDTTDRSGYWPRRLARGGDVLAPGSREQPVQLVDVRDLAEWIVRAAESRTAGVHNATGPERTLTMERFLETGREVSRADARLVWVDEEFLLRNKVNAYNELPVWVPERYQAFGTVNCAGAIASGLRYRALADTLRDTLEWDASLPPGPRTPRVGFPLPPSMTPEREVGLLRAWWEEAMAGG
jgi:2'-hydroxyisoflavone reductase